jgi:hypothetical protein
MEQKVRPVAELLGHVIAQLLRRRVPQRVVQYGRLEPPAFFVWRQTPLIRPLANKLGHPRDMRAACRCRDRPFGQLEINLH